jgi:glutamate decarboxylase
MRLGFEGYRQVQLASQDVARYLAARIGEMGPFDVLHAATDLPVVTFRLADPAADGYTVFDLSERLRLRGWLVPAYTFPADLQDTAVLRIVVRNGFTRDFAELLIADLREQVATLTRAPQKPIPLMPGGQRSGFAH